MSSGLPESHRDLIDGAIPVTVATIMPDGQPQLSVVWCNSDRDTVLINTTRGRQKEQNLLRDPRIAILSIDPDNPYRYIEIRGIVDEIAEEGAVEHINELSRLYTGGRDYYGDHRPAEMAEQEIRVTCRIRPKRIRTAG